MRRARRLVAAKEERRLGMRDSNDATAKLKTIDHVLQVIFKVEHEPCILPLSRSSQPLSE